MIPITTDGQVYQPAEDSELLAQVAVERIAPADRVLEVGTGSGYVAQRVHEETGSSVITTEINPHACRQAHGRFTNGCEIIRTDLVAGLSGEFDVLLFNPPYLPTDPTIEGEDWMERALSGGPDGRIVIEEFLERVERVMASDAHVYLLASSLTDLEAVRACAEKNGFDARIVAEKSIPFETLAVFEITRKH